MSASFGKSRSKGNLRREREKEMNKRVNFFSDLVT